MARLKKPALPPRPNPAKLGTPFLQTTLSSASDWQQCSPELPIKKPFAMTC